MTFQVDTPSGFTVYNLVYHLASRSLQCLEDSQNGSS